MQADDKKGAGMRQAPFDRYLWLGCATLLILVFGLGGWAALASISGAVIATGVVAVEGKPKIIQHIDGGIVGEILVRDGNEVETGDVLLRLDATQIQASLAIVESKLHEALALQARLEAELNGASELVPPTELDPLLNEPAVTNMFHGQQELFEARSTTRRGRIQQLELRVAQYHDQIDSLEALHQAMQKQNGLVAEELADVEKLHARGHIPITRVRAIAQDAARLEGETAEHLAQLAEARGALAEARAEIHQIRDEFREEAATELRDVVASIREFKEEQTVAGDKLGRIEIRSPVNGIVHNLNAHTIGGVISPTEPIMQIVPREDRLIIETRVEPQYIDQLHIDQPATLRFPAFNQRTTPELDGLVVNISADRLEDKTNGMAYFRTIIRVPEAQIARLNGQALLPGMPVEGFIQTERRSVLSYLVKPLLDQLWRAFREA